MQAPSKQPRLLEVRVSQAVAPHIRASVLDSRRRHLQPVYCLGMPRQRQADGAGAAVQVQHYRLAGRVAELGRGTNQVVQGLHKGGRTDNASLSLAYTVRRPKRPQLPLALPS